MLVFQTDLPIQSEIGALRLYQEDVSPVTRHIVTCRFKDSCSSYALQALEESGFWAGNWKIAGRLLMCSPIGYLVDTFESDKPPGGSRTKEAVSKPTLAGKRASPR